MSIPEVITEDIEQLARALEPCWPEFAGRTFLVTGAGGFLGRYITHLLQYLNQNTLETKLHAILLDNFVTGYDRQMASDNHIVFERFDVTQPYRTDRSIDYIIHAAGIASPVYYTKFPLETMDVGTIGTRNMLELAVEKRVRGFLFMSSSEVYGDPVNDAVPTPETYRGNVSVSGPRACYDESKRFGETLCDTFANVFDLPVKIIRPFNVYGPGIRPDDYRVLPNFIEHALRNEALPVHGSGTNTRSFCYINDALEGIFKLLFCPSKGEAFNVGNPEPEISVMELAEMVASVIPHSVSIRQIDPPLAVYASSDPKRRCPDISKLQATVDFTPRYPLEEGIQRTVRWFQSKGYRNQAS